MVELKLNRAKQAKRSMATFDGLSLETLMPGSLVDAKVANIGEGGLSVEFLGVFTGAVDREACHAALVAAAQSFLAGETNALVAVQLHTQQWSMTASWVLAPPHRESDASLASRADRYKATGGIRGITCEVSITAPEGVERAPDVQTVRSPLPTRI